MNLEELKRKMDENRYIYDETMATVLAVALTLGRPLLIEGAAGVGKTAHRSYGGTKLRQRHDGNREY